VAKKRLLSIILVLTIIGGMTSSLAAFPAGSANDPLISKSYIDSTYRGIVLNDPLDMLSNSMTVLKFKLDQAKTAKAGGSNTTTAMPNSSINLVTGSGFTLVSGTARLNSCTGTVIDLTDGTALSAGQTLSAGHRYLAAENTSAAVTVTSASKIALIGKTTVSGAVVPAFTDVTSDKWFYADVVYAVQRGLVNGRSSSIYAPDDYLSTAEAIKLAACMHQLYHNGSVSLQNDPNLWYKSYVDYAAQNGIVTKTYQNYGAPITRSEFVLIFYSALPNTEYTQKNTIADDAIPDVKLTNSNASQIYAFYRAGILIGSDANGNFFPNSNIKRSEVAAILTRMFDSSARKSITLS